jgi:hypothetical protein
MASQTVSGPRVRFSLIWKITLPFVFLSMVLGLRPSWNTFLSQEEADRFVRQLVDSGQQAKDALVRVEIDLLGLERLVANTAGVAESAAIGMPRTCGHGCCRRCRRQGGRAGDSGSERDQRAHHPPSAGGG